MQEFYTSYKQIIQFLLLLSVCLQPTSQVHIRETPPWCTKLSRQDEHSIHIYMYTTCTECKSVLGLQKQVVSWALSFPLSLHYLTEMGTYMSQMATMNYTASYLHDVDQATGTAYGTYHLDCSIRSHVISLGIRRQPNQEKYRRSRVGENLFHKIQPIARKWNNWDRLNIN